MRSWSLSLLFLALCSSCTSHFMSSWMSLGLEGSSILRSDTLLLGSAGQPGPACSRLKGLTAGQQKLCLLYPDHMAHVAKGARSGIVECQHQFNGHRWNCSAGGDVDVGFGALEDLSSRESAFLHATLSAGVVHSVSRGCKDGSISSCGCSEAERPTGLHQAYLWGGCGDNAKYGYKFAQNFIDIRERESRSLSSDASDDDNDNSNAIGNNLVNIHNNEAGRRAVIRTMKVTCKCHGVSGSCSLVTCWQQMASFRAIGDYLVEKYERASRVAVTPNGRLRVKRRSPVPTADDLVFKTKSPDFCHANDTIGTLGTTGRTCSPKSKTGPGSCSLLCCGRGHVTVSTLVSEKCNCKFHWCCRVECSTCTKKVQMTMCK